MSHKKILVACTLREFKDDVHYQTQIQFLESIKNQTYQNYLLVVTSFFEKNLEINLKKSGVKYKLFYTKMAEELKETKSKYSHWEFLNNAISLIKKDETIIMSTLSDVILEKNFFQTIVSNYSNDFSGTSWPQINYENLDQYERGQKYNINYGKKIKSELNDCLFKTISDVYFFDGNLLLNEQNKKIWNKSKMTGVSGGILQTFWCNFYNSNRINIYFKSKIHNILNYNKIDSVKVGQPENASEIANKNEVIIQELCKKLKIKKKFFDSNSSFKKLHIFNSFIIVGSFYQIFVLKIVILKTLKKKMLEYIRIKHW